MADRELAAVVVKGGNVYGPGYINPPPPDIARKITNPAAWGEEVPAEADADSPQGDSSELPPAPSDEPEVTPHPEPSEPEQPNGPAVPTEPEPETETVPVPPRSGAGSGRDAWRAFADSRGVSYAPDDTRDEIVDACQKAGVI